nr:uncharacterized protein DDB_G0271670-like isoform X2 [Drosophila takahashii]
MGSSKTSIHELEESSTGSPAYAGFFGCSGIFTGSTVCLGSSGRVVSLVDSVVTTVVVTVVIVLVSSTIGASTIGSDLTSSSTSVTSTCGSGIVSITVLGFSTSSTTGSGTVSSSSSEKFMGSSKTSIHELEEASTGRPAYAGFFGCSGIFTGSTACLGSSGRVVSLVDSVVTIVVVTVVIVLVSSTIGASTIGSDLTTSSTSETSTSGSGTGSTIGSGFTTSSTTGSGTVSSSSSEKFMGSSRTSIHELEESSTGRPAYAGFFGCSGIFTASTDCFGSSGRVVSLVDSVVTIVVVTVVTVLFSSAVEDWTHGSVFVIFSITKSSCGEGSDSVMIVTFVTVLVSPRPIFSSLVDFISWMVLMICFMLASSPFSGRSGISTSSSISSFHDFCSTTTSSDPSSIISAHDLCVLFSCSLETGKYSGSCNGSSNFVTFGGELDLSLALSVVNLGDGLIFSASIKLVT